MHPMPLYFDYAATTPVDQSVIADMVACLGRDASFGNPASASHTYGRQARDAVELARAQVAHSIGAVPANLIWTSGATESNNLALKGLALRGTHMITSLIEHKAVIDTARELEAAGMAVTWLAPDSDGLIVPAAVERALRPDTRLVSLMWVNNELGTLTDIAEVARTVRRHGAYLHVDAAQAAGKVEIDLQRLPVDLLSLSAHKLYGPKGIGALYVSDRAKLALKAQIHGGGHEQGLRSGTLATHQIVGMGSAFALAQQCRTEEGPRIERLARQLREGLLALPGVRLNGHPGQRIAHTLNIQITTAGFSKAALDSSLAVSSTSACSSASQTASHVLMAMGLSTEQARASLRLSIGRFTTEAEVEGAIAAVRQAIDAPLPFWQQ